MSDPLHLTQNQLAIWLDQSVHPDNPLYNIGGCLAVYGEIRLDLISRAVSQLIGEHDALRMCIRLQDDQPCMKVHPSLQYNLPFYDYSLAPDGERLAERWVEECFKSVFSLEDDHVYWQMALIKITPSYYLLLTKYHHLIADGWSTKVIIDRLTELYNAFHAESLGTSTDSISYADFVYEEQDYIHSVAFQRDQKFWYDQLNELPEPSFKHKYLQHSSLQIASAVVHRFKLSRTLYSRVNTWSSNQRVTTYHLLLTAVCLYFVRTLQSKGLILGIPGLNRRGARFKKLVGMCASISPLIVTFELSDSIQSLVKQISVSILKTHKHQRYPLTAIQKHLNRLKRNRDPLFDIVFSYERQEYSQSLGNAHVKARQFFSGVARYPFAVTICEFNDAHDVEIVFEGSEGYFSAQDLLLIEGRFKYILEQILGDPECKASNIDLLTDAEKQILFNQFNQSAQIPQFNSVIDQFNHWVEQTPDAKAISLLGDHYSYDELNQRIDRLVRQLSSLNVMPGQLVAVCMPRSIETIVALLAIFKRRAIYLPIDADFPVVKIESLLNQSQATVLLTVSDSYDRLCSMCDHVIAVDGMPETAGDIEFPNESIQAEDVAYIIYTSGSTGEPKGSEVGHAALSARLIWLQETFDIKPNEKVGQSIQTHFDPSLIEIFLALTSGAQLVLAPWQRMTPENFATFVIDEKINAIALVPSSLRALLQGWNSDSPHRLRVACCGGEVLSSSLAKSFIQLTGAKLFNVYGPTETTILASAWECHQEDESPLPIGRPLDYTQIYVTDEHLNLLPLGTPGEIVIAGEGVANGYFRQPELTAKTFVPNPFHPVGNPLLYKTGDFGYISPDGYLYFSDRADRQVKISGYRIELAEIELALMKYPGVLQAAVSAMRLPNSDRTVLVAYVVSEAVDRQHLQQALSLYLIGQLPDYMQPKLINIIDEIPLTSLGKVDYGHLPAPDFSLVTKRRQQPQTPLEIELLTIWCETLLQQELGVNESFFELDTDSLTAISLINRIEKRMGVRLSIAFLMTYPTVAMQAEYFTHIQEPLQLDILSTLTRHRSEINVYLAASGYGDRLRFQRLASALEGQCALHVLYPPADLASGDITISAIAHCYVQAIAKQKHENIYLAGFSIGGVTALETARLFESQGGKINKLLLLDSVYPYWPLRSKWLFKSLYWMAQWKPLKKISFNGRFLHNILGDSGIALQIEGLGHHALLPFNGQVVLIPTSGMQYWLPWSFWGWRKLLANLLVSPALKGLHGAMFRESHLPELVERILFEIKHP